MVTPEETQDVKIQATGPRKLRHISKESFQGVHMNLLIYREVLKLLSWDVWFSLINSHLLTFRLPALCCKTSMYPSSFPCLLEQFLRTIWNAVSQAIVSLSPQIKLNSHLSHCAYFFQLTRVIVWLLESVTKDNNLTSYKSDSQQPVSLASCLLQIRVERFRTGLLHMCFFGIWIILS